MNKATIIAITVTIAIIGVIIGLRLRRLDTPYVPAAIGNVELYINNNVVVAAESVFFTGKVEALNGADPINVNVQLKRNVNGKFVTSVSRSSRTKRMGERQFEFEGQLAAPSHAGRYAVFVRDNLGKIFPCGHLDVQVKD